MFKLKKIDIEVFVFGVICVCFLSPMVQRTLGVAGILLLLGVYLLLTINRFLNVRGYDASTFILIAMYIGMLFLYTLLGMSDIGAGQTNNVLFFFTFVSFLPIYKYLERRHCVFIIRVCIATLLVTMVQNYLLWVRLGFRFTQQLYRTSGIVEVIGTQYVAAIMFFGGIFFCIFLYYYKMNAKYHFLYLILAVLCFIFIVTVPQRAIVVLLSMFMLFLLLLVNGKVTRGKIICLALVSFLILLEYDVFLTWLGDFLGSERIAKRLNTIISLFSTADFNKMEGGSLKVRLQLIGVSLNTFFGSVGNFLFGVGDKADNLLVGNHSYFFDEPAKFGFFGALLSYTVVVRMIKTAKRISAVVQGEPLYNFLSVIFIIYIFRSFIGGILDPSLGVALFIFAPLLSRTIIFNTVQTDETLTH